MNQVIIMAGGKGTRMNMVDKPKTMIEIVGKPIVEHIVEAAERAVPGIRPAVIVGFQRHTIVEHFGDRIVAVEQKEQLGTGHAVACAAPLFRDREDIDRVIVIAGDQPLVSPETIEAVLDRSRKQDGAVILGTVVVPRFGGIYKHLLHYGRIVRNDDGSVSRIVEYKDATEAERAIREVNTSIYCFDAKWLWEHIDRLGSDNASKEFYLTDLVAMAMEEGKRIHAMPLPDPLEGLNVNTPEQLRAIEKIFRDRSRKFSEKPMDSTVATTYTAVVDSFTTFQSVLKNFFIPRNFDLKKYVGENFNVGVIIPSFIPESATLELVKNVLKSGDDIDICVVDDATPKSCIEARRIFDEIETLSGRVTVLKTEENKLKAGAVNYGLEHLIKSANKPEIIVIMDDDVVIDTDTIPNMVASLLERDTLGAVCSQARVMNKNENLLTRLQGLEYQGFNSLRIADDGFFSGPLVMHGMLSAFRTAAIENTGYYAENHLIEDYEITARLKLKGWHVRMASNARAWTKVPDTFGKLWRQRARWNYGGLTILSDGKYVSVIPQDLIGHGMFLATLLLVILSFFVPSTGAGIPMFILIAIIMLSAAQALIAYVFNLWYMRFYKEKDVWDWVIRITLIPEFIYANLLSLALVGAYLYFAVDTLFISRFERVNPDGKPKYRFMKGIASVVSSAFSFIGYSRKWGTR